MKNIIKSFMQLARNELRFIRVAFYLSISKSTEQISEEIVNYFSDKIIAK